jgi:hypothetical protein
MQLGEFTKMDILSPNACRPPPAVMGKRIRLLSLRACSVVALLSISAAAAYLSTPHRNSSIQEQGGLVVDQQQIDCWYFDNEGCVEYLLDDSGLAPIYYDDTTGC